MRPPLFAQIDLPGGPVSIEYQWIEPTVEWIHSPAKQPDSAEERHATKEVSKKSKAAQSQEPLDNKAVMIFLHEGLGSVAMWRDFPLAICSALNIKGLVYSRPGYGQSSPRCSEKALNKDFMHKEAFEVLPALMNALNIRTPPWLFGHSDGGSIALIHASRYASAGIIAMAPHIFVEELSLQSIAKAKEAYENTDLRARLSRYHDDVDAVFWNWNRVWLSQDFKSWSIEREISDIACPLFAVQGQDDEYGTLRQIGHIARLAPQTELLELKDCGHSPHKDQPQVLLRACSEFFKKHNT